MRQTGVWWSRQKSWSFSACRLQKASEALRSFSNKKASHRFFTTRLQGGSADEDTVLQTGHSCDAFASHHMFRQFLQKLWLHDRATGCLKTSKQTGQQRSIPGLEAILSEHTINKVSDAACSEFYFRFPRLYRKVFDREKSESESEQLWTWSAGAEKTFFF